MVGKMQRINEFSGLDGMNAGLTQSGSCTRGIDTNDLDSPCVAYAD